MNAYNNAIDKINNDFHTLKEENAKLDKEIAELKAKLEASEKMNELYERIQAFKFWWKIINVKPKRLRAIGLITVRLRTANVVPTS